jgi:hypothetical protein
MISELQIREDFMEKWYLGGQSAQPYWTAMVHDWKTMTGSEKAAQVIRAANIWAVSFVSAFSSIEMDEYCNEIEVQVLHGHIVSLANGRHADAGSVKPIYDFFFALTRTISDIVHIFEHRVPNLIALDSLHSRDTIIKGIVPNAKPADQLASWVRTVLIEMTEEEPECDICMLSFAMPKETPDEKDGQGNEFPG